MSVIDVSFAGRIDAKHHTSAVYSTELHKSKDLLSPAIDGLHLGWLSENEALKHQLLPTWQQPKGTRKGLCKG